MIGLGRFGSSLAIELIAHGSEVLGIDSDPKLVQRHADELTHVVVADSTDADVMRQLGVDEFTRAVVGIGTDLEASILTTAVLVDFEIPHIWAKAISREHGRILSRIGAHHVVLPEHEMGERVAHLVTGRMLDFIEFEDDYAMIKTRPPGEALGRSLGVSRLRAKYGVTVVGVKRPGEGFTYATVDTVVNPGDVLIVAGRTGEVERFADLP
ncbi:TrkA family potassium uptake protein [Lentzea tibetensis]|uniref:TrkA family potassium uptake protein n=1 Tax=Lentzea tibetensis TaxID=2591470 RepID=A0A563ET31_9PSEU|nr:TrkA family potassium uptake protein [Lentzea tibetensis]